MSTENDVLGLLRRYATAANFRGQLTMLMDDMDAEKIERTPVFYEGAMQLGKKLGIAECEIGPILYRDGGMSEGDATGQVNGHAKGGNGHDADRDWGEEPQWGWQANNEIPRDYIDGLKARVPIFQVFKKYTKLTRRGPNQDWDGRSPFRDDKNPGSFKVSDKLGRANDFATGESWDHIDAIMVMERKEFHEAVEMLASMAGVPMWVKEKPDFKNWLAGPFPYRDENGVQRYERIKLGVVDYAGKPVFNGGKREKIVMPRRPNGGGGFIWHLRQDPGDPPAEEQLPYRLPEALADLKAEPTIILFSAESEQSVDDLRKLGATAVSISKGVSKDDLARWFPRVDHIALRDKDEGGEKHANFILDKMDGIAARQRFLDLPDLKDKEGPDDWIKRGGTIEELYELVDRHAQDWKPETQQQEAIKDPIEDLYPLRWHGEKVTPPKYLVDGLLPEVGVVIFSGPWGMYKTFLAVELGMSVMRRSTFAGQAISHQAGVLYIAAEGSEHIPIRLAAAYGGGTDTLPFAWSENCPRLLDKNALKSLLGMAKSANNRMEAQFGRKLGLIVIDTMAVAACFTDESSNSEAQTVLNVLDTVAKKMRLLVVVVDHFGKNAEAGTRGASAKETCEGVLSILGTRSPSGKVTDTKLVARKVRGGQSGREFPFTMKPYDLGVDHEGRTISTLVVEWGELPADTAKPKRVWSNSLRVFKNALDNALAAPEAFECQPFGPEGAIVRVADKEAVRREFYKTYSTDGDTEKQRSDAKRQALHSCVKQAQEQGLIGVASDVPHASSRLDVLWVIA
jgi:hypothetical protein